MKTSSSSPNKSNLNYSNDPNKEIWNDDNNFDNNNPYQNITISTHQLPTIKTKK